MSLIRPVYGYKKVTLPDVAYDSFGNIRVTSPTTLFDSQQQYGQSPLLWETSITGSAAADHLPNESAVRLQTTSASGDKVIRQTREYFRYQPGKSLKISLTGQAPSDTDNRRYRSGYFDAANGVFVEVVDGEVFFVLRSYVTGLAVDTRVPQDEWSVDKMDGKGESGFNLDFTKSFIFITDLEWLGVGTVRVGFQLNGKPYFCHEFHHANIGNTTYMTTANLPIRYELENTDTTAGTDNALAICATVVSEGGFEEDRGYPFGAERTSLKGVTAEVPVFSLRPALTINSITNRARIEVDGIQLYAEDESAIFRVYYGGTLTNESFSPYDATYSGVETDQAATAISGGLRIGPAVVVPAASQGQQTSPSASVADLLSKLPITLNIAGGHPTTPFTDCYTITAEAVDGVTTSNVFASIGWREIY